VHVTELTPLGAVVEGIRVDAMDDVAVLRDLLGRHGVLVMPGQRVDDDAFTRFLRSFGDLVFTSGETPVAGHPDLNVVTNVGRSTPPRSTFHVDTSYVREPPAYTALRAVEVPERGGRTLFSNQYRAYDTLPDDVTRDLAGRTIRHVVTGVEPTGDDETSAHHPILRTHPISGRTSLYLTTPARCAAVSGLSDQPARDLVRFLFAHSTREDNVLGHTWAAGDVVMWDNGCVMHQADHADVVGARTLHRGMVAGFASV
jgi:taurine dioxygenase